MLSKVAPVDAVPIALTNFTPSSVGSSSSISFLAWRLSVSKSYRVSSFQGLQTREDGSVPVIFDSNQFGGSSKYSADYIYDDISEFNLPYKFDLIIVALDSLRHVSRLSKSISQVAGPNTAILFDVSNGVPPISQLVKQKFAEYPLGLIISEELVIKTGNKQLLHTKSDAQALLTSIGDRQDTTQFREAAFALQSAGCNAVFLSDSSEFRLRQWQQAIATIALQPLSIVLDTPDLNTLSTDIVAKPIYEGLMNELFAIAKKDLLQSECDRVFPLPTRMTSFNSWVPSIPGIQSSSYLYYLFYKQFSFPVDVYLLQPILMGDELGVRTPYLECLFAQMSHLYKANSTPGQLFERRGSASSGPPGPSAASAAIVKSREAELRSREQELSRREQELYKREQFLRARDMQMRQGPPGQHAPPPPQQNGPVNRRPSIPRPMSALPAIQSTSPPPATPVPADINMMSFTQRRSRRSFVKSQSAMSLNQHFGVNGYGGGAHSGPSPSMVNGGRRSSQTFSQSLDLDELSSMPNDRYGGVSSKTKISSSRASVISRSNSIVSIAPPALVPSNGYANGGYNQQYGTYTSGTNAYTNGPSRQMVAPRLASPQESQSNLLDPVMNRSSSSSSPSTPPPSAPYISYK